MSLSRITRSVTALTVAAAIGLSLLHPAHAINERAPQSTGSSNSSLEKSVSQDLQSETIRLLISLHHLKTMNVISDEEYSQLEKDLLAEVLGKETLYHIEKDKADNTKMSINAGAMIVLAGLMVVFDERAQIKSLQSMTKETKQRYGGMFGSMLMLTSSSLFFNGTGGKIITHGEERSNLLKPITQISKDLAYLFYDQFQLSIAQRNLLEKAIEEELSKIIEKAADHGEKRISIILKSDDDDTSLTAADAVNTKRNPELRLDLYKIATETKDENNQPIISQDMMKSLGDFQTLLDATLHHEGAQKAADSAKKHIQSPTDSKIDLHLKFTDALLKKAEALAQAKQKTNLTADQKAALDYLNKSIKKSRSAIDTSKLALDLMRVEQE